MTETCPVAATNYKKFIAWGTFWANVPVAALAIGGTLVAIFWGMIEEPQIRHIGDVYSWYLLGTLIIAFQGRRQLQRADGASAGQDLLGQAIGLAVVMAGMAIARYFRDQLDLEFVLLMSAKVTACLFGIVVANVVLRRRLAVE